MHRTGTKHIILHMQKSVIQWSVISKFTCTCMGKESLFNLCVPTGLLERVICFYHTFVNCIGIKLKIAKNWRRVVTRNTSNILQEIVSSLCHSCKDIDKIGKSLRAVGMIILSMSKYIMLKFRTKYKAMWIHVVNIKNQKQFYLSSFQNVLYLEDNHSLRFIDITLGFNKVGQNSWLYRSIGGS